MNDDRNDNGGDIFRLSLFKEPILDSINEGVFTVDLQWRITSFNCAAERITGISRAEAIGQRCSEVFRTNICEASCALKETLASGKPVINNQVFIVDGAGDRIPIKISTAVLHLEDGEVIGGVETFEDLRQIEELRKRLRDKHTFSDIVGRSPAVSRLFELLPQIAESESAVLIQGPSGTGKELFARALHDLSPRRNGPFVAINCGALPDSLLEAELFGYKAGAFTDAKRDKPGRFASANGGTLFLDEIGDVSPAMQASLLRVLEEKTYEPLGSVKSFNADVRVLAATNKDLEQLVERGEFREDLFYRIHVFRIDIPPLVDRREDIPLLVEHFIDVLNRVHSADVQGLSPQAYSVVLEHEYPGNVRELKNILEHALVLCRDGLIQLSHLPVALQRRSPEPPVREEITNLEASQIELIRKVLLKHRGARNIAAKELGINPSTLYRKIVKYGIDPNGEPSSEH